MCVSKCCAQLALQTLMFSSRFTNPRQVPTFESIGGSTGGLNGRHTQGNDRRLGGKPATGKSFRFVRACVRAVSIAQWERAQNLTPPFSLFPFCPGGFPFSPQSSYPALACFIGIFPKYIPYMLPCVFLNLFNQKKSSRYHKTTFMLSFLDFTPFLF